MNDNQNFDSLDLWAPRSERALPEKAGDPGPEEEFTPINFSDELMPEIGIEESDQLFEGLDPEAHVHNTRVFRRKARRRVRKHLISEGAQFIYGLLVLTGTAGLIALATTIQSVLLITTALIISPLVLGYAVVSWKRWLRGAPYVYRLLTSLGEDAENLVHWRVPFFRL